MLAYYLELGFRSFRRARALTLLTLLSIAMGVAACMTTLTVYHVLAADPIPGKSARLFNVQLDAEPKIDYTPGGEPALQLTRFDATHLLADARGVHQLMMTGSNAALDPAGSGSDLRPFLVRSRFTSADFFTMFETPWLHGSAWTAADDAAKARVAVIGRELAEKLFGAKNPVGQSLRLRDRDYRIVGVLDDWRPAPQFFDLTAGAYGRAAEVYLPFETAMEAKLGSSGNMTCWAGSSDPRAVEAKCAWLQYWVELDTPEQQRAYRDYLVHYSEDQGRAGRFERPANPRLRKVMDWLAFRKVVPGDVQLQLWLAMGFLLVCLTNAVGLLLAKCLRRSGEIGVRRALGAPKRAIFMQFLVEAGSLGLAGGVLGLLLTLGGLWIVRHGASEYAALASLDLPMLATTLGLALAASLLAGLLPAWRACQVTPALQLKTQ
ncbi:MAG: ABC transporter permease [Pelomonas sp.]|nr:ABC transporter permease [Roseateles sp.]